MDQSWQMGNCKNRTCEVGNLERLQKSLPYYVKPDPTYNPESPFHAWYLETKENPKEDMPKCGYNEGVLDFILSKLQVNATSIKLDSSTSAKRNKWFRDDVTQRASSFYVPRFTSTGTLVVLSSMELSIKSIY